MALEIVNEVPDVDAVIYIFFDYVVVNSYMNII